MLVVVALLAVQCASVCMVSKCTGCDIEGKEKNLGPMSLSDCKKLCMADDRCFGIDYGKNSRWKECVINIEQGSTEKDDPDFDAWEKKDDDDCPPENYCPSGMFPYLADFSRCCPYAMDLSGREWRYGGNQTECFGGFSAECQSPPCSLLSTCQGALRGNSDLCETSSDTSDWTTIKFELGDGACRNDGDCADGLTCSTKCSDFDGRNPNNDWPTDQDNDAWDMTDMCCDFPVGNERKYLGVKEGQAVLIYNLANTKKTNELTNFLNERLTDMTGDSNSENKVMTSGGDIRAADVWLMKKPYGDEMSNRMMLVNAETGRRLTCNGGGNGNQEMQEPESAIESTDYLYLVPADPFGRTYFIYNNECLDAEEHTPNFLGMGTDDRQAHWQSLSGHVNYRWRFEDPYLTDAMWHTVRILNNTWNKEVTFNYEVTMGFSKTFSESSANTQGTTKMMKQSAGLAFKRLDLGAEHEKTATSEFSSGVSSAQDESYTVIDKFTVTVPPGSCVQIAQLKVTQDDNSHAVEGMTFHSFSTWTFDCKDAHNKAAGDVSQGVNVCRAGCVWDLADGCVKDTSPADQASTALFAVSASGSSTEFVRYLLPSIGVLAVGILGVQSWQKWSKQPNLSLEY